MRHIDRRMNPALMQEVTYSWEQQEHTGQKILFNMVSFSIVFGLLYLFLA
ncbi:MAG: hypothetical protein V4751_14100 [Pseudomonadota bacterium]